ncbi:MAG: prepilin-type N-terminal cleavage/methylation domain-containing protein [Candidatus Aminicenantes bacterium]|nr:prepilin-type N-terminal cleavage/methylation domain-containing protein [Candidatus Aminicenantes bacterium]
MARQHERGYTLIEIIIVFTMIGILVGLALPEYKNAVRKGKEAALKEDLFQFRKLIDQYYQDKGRYPAALQTLVDEGYLRKIPADPFTNMTDWSEVREEPTAEEIEPGMILGIVDVKSASELSALDGTPYNTW